MLYFKLAVALLISLWAVLAEIPDGNLHLVVCDVGQGDAILLTQGSWQMLVDGGRGKQVLDCLGAELPFWDKTLEVVVATHPDADHIGGLDDVFQAYHVEQFVFSGDSKDTTDFDRLSESFSREKTLGSLLIEPKLGSDLAPADTLDITIISPLAIEELPAAQRQSLMPATEPKSEQNTESPETVLSASKLVSDAQKPTSDIDYNNRSIVLYIEYGRFTALLTGDLEQSGEQALLESGLIKPITVLKVGHHGAKTGSSLAFTSHVAPEIAVISVGQNNAYGHPSAQVLQNLEKVDAQILRTDHHGTIELITNGEWLKYEKLRTSL